MNSHVSTSVGVSIIIVLTGALVALVIYSTRHETFVSYDRASSQQKKEVFFKKALHALQPKQYNILSAERALQRSLQGAPDFFAAHYALARVRIVLGDYSGAVRAADRALLVDPSDVRTLYVRSLAYAHAGEYSKAEEDMRLYIQNEENVSWQSHLDLGWILFKQERSEEAKNVLTRAVSEFGGNAWLHASLSGVFISLGDHSEARRHAALAEQHLSTVTREEWVKNYSLNDPKQAEEGIASLAQVIEINRRVAQGDVAHVKEVPRIFAKGMSEKGVSGGVVVQACGESCVPGYGQSCSSSNACGILSTGTVDCMGRCATTSGLPAGFGAPCTVATTNCAAVPGRINCNGQCAVYSYPTGANCSQGLLLLGDENDFELDEFGNKVPRVGCSAAKVVIRALPLLVRQGKVSALQWVANEAVSCTVTGGGQTWAGLQGVQITNPIQETTKYTVTCQPLAQCTGQQALPFSASVDVRVVPDWQEI